MSKNNLKVGDKLRCIYEEDIYLTYGKIYQIDKLYSDRTYGDCMVMINNLNTRLCFTINEIDGISYTVYL